MTFQSMPRPARLYINFLWLAGVAAFIGSFSFPFFRPPDLSLVLYILIVGVTARITVKFPYTDIHFSLDSPFVLVVLMLYGPFAAILADAVAKIVMTLPHIDRHAWYKVPFNVSSGALAVFGAFVAFEALKFGNMETSSAYVLPIIGLTVGNFLVATVTVALVICIVQRLNIVTFWIKNFLPTGVGFIASGAIATLLFVLDKVGDYLGFLVSVPLVGLVYFSQKIYLQKETEAHNHIHELENLHLSSIQSLSLALDAKDEYTHGHVRRVSNYAVGLAKHLGMTDKNALKAIAFAGLVHDIGKIGVPDAILNKPGKYTEAEYNRMKIHPVISAEILKSIPLPFPIGKTVRHHHEKWNGKGYPDGLMENEIPYESRLLAVADIYDAVRSDRPYRPKMDRKRAIEVLEKEKGHTLDPDMVDVFIENLDTLEKGVHDVLFDLDDRSIQDIVKASYAAYEQEIELPEELRNRKMRREAQIFEALSEFVQKGKGLKSRLKSLTSSLSRLVPHNALVVYIACGPDDRMIPSFVSGKDSMALANNVLERGAGISGWVFHNGASMLTDNHDTEFPILRGQDNPYQSILSIPIGTKEDALGALTLYSENRSAFTTEDKKLLDRLSPFLFDPISRILANPEKETCLEPVESRTDIIQFSRAAARKK